MLDEWVNLCKPHEMTRLAKFIQYMQTKRSVNLTTVFFFTCVDTFHGNAKALYQLFAPPRTWKKKKKKKTSFQTPEPEPVPKFIKHVRLYKPKDYLVERFLRARGTRSNKKIKLLQKLAGGDIRQLLLLIQQPLAFIAADRKHETSTIPTQHSIFELVGSVFDGGARLTKKEVQQFTPPNMRDLDETHKRMYACTGRSLQILKGVTAETNERILQFLYANQHRPSDQISSLGDFGEEARDDELLQYSADIADELSLADILYPFDTAQKTQHVVQSLSVHTSSLLIEEYEIDDSVKMVAPSKDKSITNVMFKQKRMREAQTDIMQTLCWHPADAKAACTITRASVRPYLDFVGNVLESAESNYHNFSDHLQTVPREMVNAVFPKAFKRPRDAPPPTANLMTKSPLKLSKPDTLFMPF